MKIFLAGWGQRTIFFLHWWYSEVVSEIQVRVSVYSIPNEATRADATVTLPCCVAHTNPNPSLGG